MKKIFVSVLILVTMNFAGCGGSLTTGEKIVIGIDDEFPPISFHNERNELVGFDIDLAKESAKRMGMIIEFKSINWYDKREEITSRNVDMIWNGLDITEERKEYMIFTEPYMDDRQIFLVKKGNDCGIHSEGDLAGKIIGMQAGSTSEDYFNKNKELRDSLKECKTYVKLNEVLNALEKNEIEVLVCDELIARYEMNKHPADFEVLNITIGSAAEMAVGFRKEDNALRDKVQKAFDEMIKDGTAKEISEKWFHADLIKSRK